MKIATYNVNGINGRPPVFLRWLKEYRPEIVCTRNCKRITAWETQAAKMSQ